MHKVVLLILSFSFGRKIPVLTSFLFSGLSCIAVAIIPMRSDDGKRTSKLLFFIAFLESNSMLTID